MTTSAMFLGIAGLILSFFPNEIVAYLPIEKNILITLFLQIISALYLGFGMLNWMAKGTRIGGIYNRPVAIGNFMHFGVGAIALVKIVFEIKTNPGIIISLTIIYVIFAMSYAYIFMTNPGNLGKEQLKTVTD